MAAITRLLDIWPAEGGLTGYAEEGLGSAGPRALGPNGVVMDQSIRHPAANWLPHRDDAGAAGMLASGQPPDRLTAALSPADAFVVRTASVALWLCVLTQKLAIVANIQAPLLIAIGAVAVLMANGLAFISVSRSVMFCVLVFMITVTHLVGHGGAPFSVLAILLALGIYALFIVVVPISAAAYGRLLVNFQVLAAFIAGLVYLQWAMQFAGLEMLNLETIIPSGQLYVRYNYIQPVHWGSLFNKPNGVFMLEASHASQLLAMALVIELCLLQRLRYIVFLGIAQLSTFGGTGFLLLVLSAPVMLFYFRPQLLLVLLIASPLVMGAAYKLGVVDNFTSRSTEFGVESSSANGRFVETYRFMARTVVKEPRTIVFGLGAGNAKLDGEVTNKIVLNPLTKLVTEYGIIVALLWLLLIHLCVLRSGAPMCVCFAVLIQYNLLNGSLLMPIHVMYCYLLAGIFLVGNRNEAPPDTTVRPLPS
jgi:hypothetical protein